MMILSVRDVERTGRDTTIASWGVALVVMVGSAASAGIGFRSLGEHWAIGVMTGLGVDLALASGLVIGRRLRAVGVSTYWGTVLLWLTAAMTLCLNSGAAALTGRWVLAIAHAFLPVLLVVVCEAGSQAHLTLHRLARQAAVRDQAGREARLAVERAAREAEQVRVAAEHDRTRQDRVRAADLAAAAQERDITDRREAREHEARQAVVSLASVLALGAAWRRRPSARPRRVSQPRPSRSEPAVPVVRPAAVPVTDELLSQARRVRADRASRGDTAGRAVLQRELGVPERTARELARRLDEQPLQVLTGGR